ncbi:MAG TPA: 8-oxoguanine deaminase [Thermotogota bacterium]|nr:8-oxoguanine deaminase [Thermotogota bacterium]
MIQIFYNIDVLATMDEDRNELTKAYIIVDDSVIREVGAGDVDFARFDRYESHDMSGTCCIPGMVNTHHHLFQSMFRNVRGAQNLKLFDWLIFLYERWKHITNKEIYNAALVGIYEMMKTGVTTTSDMFYLHPKGTDKLFDTEIEAGQRTGVRFHPCRGSMSLSKKDGGLPPDSVVQTEDRIMEDCERVVRKYHDTSKGSMLRVALAPCSPFSVTEALMQETLRMAEEYDLLIHTHLAETLDEDDYCLERVGLRPVDYMEKLGWLTPRAWFAHCVWLNDDEIRRFAENRVGVSHCPVSNMRLGSGTAPIVEMLKHPEIKVSLAVDGSASNDTGNMIGEARSALMLQRVSKGADCITPREVLEMGTLGGAKVLGMDDYIGSIETGKSADFVFFRIDTLEMAGGISDPVSALILCNPGTVFMSVINGVIRIKEGEVIEDNFNVLIRNQNAMLEAILKKEL